MDKIWDRNPSKSEIIGHCGGDDKNEWSRLTDKSQKLRKKHTKKTPCNCMAIDLKVAHWSCIVTITQYTTIAY